MTQRLPTDRELEALKILWHRGRATVREIWSELGRADAGLAYTSVLSLMQAMEQKGLVGHEEVDLGSSAGIDPGAEVADLGQLLPQGLVVEPVETGEFVAGEEPRAGGPVVVVDRLSVDSDPRGRDHLLHLLRRLGQWRDPPALAPPLDRVVHPGVAHVEEFDLVLGNQLLKQLVGGR